MDLRTLGAVVAVTAVCLLVVLILLYRQNRQYAGLDWWALGQCFMVVTFVSTALAPSSPAWIPVLVLTSSSTVLSLLCMYVGIVRFLGRPVPRFWPWCYLGGTVLVLGHVSLTSPDTGLRRAGVYLLLAGVQVLTVRALTVHRQEYMRQSAVFLRLIFGLAAPYYTVLAVLAVLDVGPDLRVLEPSAIPLLAFLGAVALMVMWTFGLSLLVSEHLRYDLAEDRANLHEIFLASPDATVISRLSDGLILDVNHGFTRLLGHRREQVVGRAAVQVGIWGDARQRQRLLDALREGPVDEFQTVLQTRDGRPLDVAMSARVLRLAGEPHIITVSRDVTERKMWEAELRLQATTDDLSGVLNRRAFLARVQDELHRCRAESSTLALAIIDLDEFKRLNDSFGHAAGDAAVRAFAMGASTALRPGDALGRLGGDEFGVLMPATAITDGEAVVEDVRRAITQRPLLLGDQFVPLSFSAGIAIDFGCDSVDDLFAKADRGLYRAKARGRNQVVAA